MPQDTQADALQDIASRAAALEACFLSLAGAIMALATQAQEMLESLKAAPALITKPLSPDDNEARRIVSEALAALRTIRDAQDWPLRGALNAVCDRLDVAESKMAEHDRARMDESLNRIMAAFDGESPGDGYMLNPEESRAALDAIRSMPPIVPVSAVKPGAAFAVGGPVKAGTVYGGSEGPQKLLLSHDSSRALSPEEEERFLRKLMEWNAGMILKPTILDRLGAAKADDSADPLNGLSGMDNPIGRGMYWTDEPGERADGRAPLRGEGA